MKQLIIKEREKQYEIGAKKYYENNKERLREQVKNNYREISEKRKGHKQKSMGEIDIKICLRKINKD